MGKLFCMMGKSASGKDTVYRRLLEEGELPLSRIVPYTTRPARFGETDGEEYYFVNEAQLAHFDKAGRVIELRSYHTVYGVWNYFTVDDGQIDLSRRDYLMIATVEAYMKIRDYFGDFAVVPIYIEVEDGLRLQRALDRERLQQNPGYAELCRRFLADAQDFSEERLLKAGIRRRFLNENLEDICGQITAYIRTFM